MTLLFPRLDSPELAPFAEPFGRMMLAYGRATAAAIALARIECPSEADAVKFVNGGSKDLGKRLRRLFKGKLNSTQFARMNTTAKRFAQLAEHRNQLVHGEWWLNVFDDGRLQIRKLWRGKLKHTGEVTAEMLEGWARELDAIADELDEVEYQAKRARTATDGAD
jgi:hypothetical protein